MLGAGKSTASAEEVCVCTFVTLRGRVAGGELHWQRESPDFSFFFSRIAEMEFLITSLTLFIAL